MALPVNDQPALLLLTTEQATVRCLFPDYSQSQTHSASVSVSLVPTQIPLDVTAVTQNTDVHHV